MHRSDGTPPAVYPDVKAPPVGFPGRPIDLLKPCLLEK